MNYVPASRFTNFCKEKKNSTQKLFNLRLEVNLPSSDKLASPTTPRISILIVRMSPVIVLPYSNEEPLSHQIKSRPKQPTPQSHHFANVWLFHTDAYIHDRPRIHARTVLHTYAHREERNTRVGEREAPRGASCKQPRGYWLPTRACNTM